jgi:phage terminase small subunit
MKGRKPKPRALKILAGNPGRRPLPKAEPIPTGLAEMPKWLSKEAVKVWEELAPEAITLGTLTSYDADQFGMLCAELAEYRKNPGEVMTTAKTLLTKLFAEFGKGPSSRTRISIPKRDQGDDENRFFGRTG